MNFLSSDMFIPAGKGKVLTELAKGTFSHCITL